MTFEEYLIEMGKRDSKFEAVIDNSDMPETFCPGDNYYFSDYCHQKYGDLLSANVKIINAETDITNEVIEVEYDNYRKACNFCMAMAGYGSELETELLFPEKETEEVLDLTVSSGRR